MSDLSIGNYSHQSILKIDESIVKDAGRNEKRREETAQQVRENLAQSTGYEAIAKRFNSF